MAQINFHKREVNCKIVYYGPGLSGKTTNLQVVHDKAPNTRKGELTSIATEGDRTLFFDFMPLNLGRVGGLDTKFQLYTVPGQVYYNATRKLVLQGADGVVFVADSQEDKIQENIESLRNLEENLSEHNLDISTLPLVLQWNKRDLPNALPVDVLEDKLNKYGAPTFEAVAITGEGVFPTLKKLSGMVLDHLNQIYGVNAMKKKPAASSASARTRAAVPSSGPPSAAPRERPAEKQPATAGRSPSSAPPPRSAPARHSGRRAGMGTGRRPAPSRPPVGAGSSTGSPKAARGGYQRGGGEHTFVITKDEKVASNTMIIVLGVILIAAIVAAILWYGGVI